MTNISSATPPGPAKERRAIFAAFGIVSFRFQFGSDLLVAWAIEMEVLILGWYVLVETESAFLLALLGAMRFGGTLLAPLIGSLADNLSRKYMLLTIRAAFAGLAIVLMVLSLTAQLVPWQAFVVVTLTGLMRPADMMLRQSLIADAVPRELLTNALGFSRTTIDSARIVGALAGAGLMASVGMGPAYVVVALFYGASTGLGLGIRGSAAKAGKPLTRAFDDLRVACRYLRGATQIKNVLALAFLVNLTLLSVTGGLLPLVAKNVYGLGSTGLGFMVASFAGGALVGSLITATVLRSVRADRLMLSSIVVWHVLMVVFAQIQSATWGIPMLAVVGLASSLAMVPMSSCLMLAIPLEFRARIMGVRQLAVFGLPLGLLISGLLVDPLGVALMFSLYGLIGLAVTLWIGHKLRAEP